MYIAFTGHRDKLCNEADLEKVLKDYPNAIWVHGGAIGFEPSFFALLLDIFYLRKLYS
jgi:hypothetical protein